MSPAPDMRVPTPRPDAVALTRSQLVEEPLGGRTWRGSLTNLGDRLYTDLRVEIRFVDRKGRTLSGLDHRAGRLAPGAELDLQSRLPAEATGLRIEALDCSVEGVRCERSTGRTWPFDRVPDGAIHGDARRA
jgi:hypothetical protein